jgi:hypothetical protein
MTEEERRKNETSTHVSSHGYSHVPCLRLFLAESRLYTRDTSVGKMRISPMLELVRWKMRKRWFGKME